MTIQKAAQKFNTVTVEGWNDLTQQWDLNVGLGSFQVFDRFISSRTFGQKVRVFMCGLGNEIDVSKYSLVRTKVDQTNFIVVSDNKDIISDKIYSSIYMLREAAFAVDIIQDVVTTNAAGVASSTVETVVKSTFADIERSGKADSSEISEVTYTTDVMTLPNFVTLDEDSRIKSQGRYYEVREIYKELRVLKASVVAGGIA